MLNFSDSPQSKGISDFLGWCEKAEKAMEPYRKAEKAMEPFLLEWRKAENVLSRIGIFAPTPNPKQRSADEMRLPGPAAPKRHRGRPSGSPELQAILDTLKYLFADGLKFPHKRELQRRAVEERLGREIKLRTFDRARKIFFGKAV